MFTIYERNYRILSVNANIMARIYLKGKQKERNLGVFVEASQISQRFVAGLVPEASHRHFSS